MYWKTPNWWICLENTDAKTSCHGVGQPLRIQYLTIRNETMFIMACPKRKEFSQSINQPINQSLYLYLFIYTCLSISMYLYLFICIYLSKPIYLHLFIYIYIMYVCVYIYIYTPVWDVHPFLDILVCVIANTFSSYVAYSKPM